MKILLFDIETAPMITYNWGLYQELTSTKFIDKDWYVLCWCAKWLGKKRVITGALCDDKKYKPHYNNDRFIMRKLWDLLDEADVVVAHNAKAFDIKKVNARFLYHGFVPPSPYKVVDTLLVARRYFKFVSNKLDDLGQKLKLGRKTPTGGFDLWLGCMAGVKKDWRNMVSYCKQDVVLLEKLYLRLLPYITNHPNQNYYNIEDKHNCSKCNSRNTEKRGFSYTASGKKQRLWCRSCGGWSQITGKSAKNAI